MVAIALFLALKLLAYSAWCRLALRWLAPSPPAELLRRAFLLGAVRLGLGLVLGATLVGLLNWVAPESNRLGVSPLLLAGGFVGLRWLEWSFVGALAARRADSVRGVLIGRGGKEQLWRLGGLGLSFATDAAGALGIGALGLIPC